MMKALFFSGLLLYTSSVLLANSSGFHYPVAGLGEAVDEQAKMLLDFNLSGVSVGVRSLIEVNSEAPGNLFFLGYVYRLGAESHVHGCVPIKIEGAERSYLVYGEYIMSDRVYKAGTKLEPKAFVDIWGYFNGRWVSLPVELLNISVAKITKRHDVLASKQHLGAIIEEVGIFDNGVTSLIH